MCRGFCGHAWVVRYYWLYVWASGFWLHLRRYFVQITFEIFFWSDLLVSQLSRENVFTLIYICRRATKILIVCNDFSVKLIIVLLISKTYLLCMTTCALWSSENAKYISSLFLQEFQIMFCTFDHHNIYFVVQCLTIWNIVIGKW